MKKHADPGDWKGAPAQLWFAARQCPARVLAALLWATIMAAPALAETAHCTLAKLVEFPVLMSNLRPIVTAKVNGTDVRFELDTGSFYTIISAASAAELKLRTYAAPAWFRVSGIGGSSDVSLTRIRELILNGVPLHDKELIVGGSDFGQGGDSVGVLGRDILQNGDAEFDLSHGVARLMVPKNCDGTVLAYWLKPGESYSVIGIGHDSQIEYELGSHVNKVAHFQEPIAGKAYVNGVEVSAMFDSGAPTSFLTVKAAARAGIKLDSPGVVSAGFSSGFGPGQVANYIAPVASFKIGDEEVRNTRLRLGDTDSLAGVDMLIGADYFLSHHIYIATSQHKLYFTYNGGPVFNLKTVAASATPASSAAASSANAVALPAGNLPRADAQNDATPAPFAAPAPSSAADPNDPGAAADHERRGAALASRQQFDQALPELTRACELAPDNPEYFYQRGLAYWNSKQRENALADFDRTIQLKPDHVLALLARGAFRIQAGEKGGAKADLDAASAATPREDGIRARLGLEYARLDLFAQAIEQYDLWIASHSGDSGLPGVLNGRCWTRALAGFDLQHALEDCTKVLKLATKASPAYRAASDSRGLVWLRLGNYDRSIADYDASLKLEPQNAWSLYGRGVDEFREKKTAEGEADMARAKAIAADIGETFGKYGISP